MKYTAFIKHQITDTSVSKYQHTDITTPCFHSNISHTSLSTVFKGREKSDKETKTENKSKIKHNLSTHFYVLIMTLSEQDCIVKPKCKFTLQYYYGL